jgi:2-C-methyl-D-erythritol 2,4-cyclodiphosphate synthase
MNDIRIGQGYDVHQLVEGRPLILGGVQIDHPKGLAGHSDADVLLHAITDALLGALALGDIGTHFPDDGEKFKDIDSRIMLRKVAALIADKGYRIGNIDSTIIAQKPKLAGYIATMTRNIAEDLELNINRVSVKATTSEKLGFEGKKLGMTARASVIIFKRDNG